MDGTMATVMLFAGNFAPRNWAFCEGQLLAISQNTALFSLLGTVYGGDGRTSFGLPDLRGRTAISPGTGPGLPTYRQGQRGGQADVTLNLLQIPAHTHASTVAFAGAPTATLARGTGKGTGGNFIADIATNFKPNGGGTSIDGLTVDMSGLTGTATIGQTGGNQSHENMQPYLAIYYVICMQGLFPSRS